MILYLDSSAIVKLYIEETGSPLVHKLVNNAEVIATSIIAFAELIATFSRLLQEKALTRNNYRQLVNDFKVDWESYLKLEITESLIKIAGDLTEIHLLSGFDAIHLSSCITLSRRVSDTVTFACWDNILWNAVKKEKFNIAPEKINHLFKTY